MSEKSQIVTTSNNLVMLMLRYLKRSQIFFLLLLKNVYQTQKSFKKLWGYLVFLIMLKYQQILKIFLSSLGMWELKIEALLSESFMIMLFAE